MRVLPLVFYPCPVILLHLFWVYNLHMRENMQFLTFWAGPTSLKMMFSISIHLLVNDKISFFFVDEWNSIMYKYYIFLIHLSVLGHLGCSHSLAIVNSACKIFLLRWQSLCCSLLCWLISGHDASAVYGPLWSVEHVNNCVHGFESRNDVWYFWLEVCLFV
jgi:hypothetical protein